MKLIDAVITTAAVLVLAGCSAQPTTTPTSAPAKPADWSFCSHLSGSMQLYADMIVALSQTGNIDQGDLNTLGGYFTDLREEGSSKVTSMLTDYAGPYDTIKKAVDSGAGNVNFNTDAYKNASTDLLNYCAKSVGYHGG